MPFIGMCLCVMHLPFLALGCDLPFLALGCDLPFLALGCDLPFLALGCDLPFLALGCDLPFLALGCDLPFLALGCGGIKVPSPPKNPRQSGWISWMEQTHSQQVRSLCIHCTV